MRVVFDLDGTLADNKHREHFIKGEKKDWDGFFEACDQDTPIWPAINTLYALHEADHHIEIWSGRGAGKDGSVRDKTFKWLMRDNKWMLPNIFPAPIFFYSIRTIPVRMRPHEDYTPDDKLKLRWLEMARAQGRAPDLVFDDRQRCVDMWRAEGIPCFQVAPGDF